MTKHNPIPPLPSLQADQHHGILLAEQILKRLRGMGADTWVRAGALYLWRIQAMRKAAQGKIETMRAQIEAANAGPTDAQEKALQELREEGARRLKKEQAAAKAAREELEAEREAALKEAEDALNSLAAGGGDEEAMKRIMMKQKEASERLSNFKRELRDAHVQRLAQALKHVFQAWEDSQVLRLVHLWHDQYGIWRVQANREKEMQKAIRQAVRPVQMQLDEALATVAILQAEGPRLRVEARVASHVSLWSLYQAIGRHAVSQLRVRWEMWAAFIGERRAVRHLNSLLQEQLKELVQARP